MIGPTESQAHDAMSPSSSSSGGPEYVPTDGEYLMREVRELPPSRVLMLIAYVVPR
jgi:hypothetical protein